MASVFGQVFPPANLNGTGGSQDLTGGGDTAHYAMGMHVRPDVDGTITAIWHFCPSANFPTNADFGVGVFKVDPVTGVNGTITNLSWEAKTPPGAGAQGTWVEYTLTTPISVLAGDELYIVVRTNRYAFSGKVFDTGGVVSGHLSADINSGPYPNCAFLVVGDVPASTPPAWAGASSFNSTFYGIDVEFTPAGGPTNATATPSTVTGAASIGTPGMSLGTTATPSTVSAVASVFTPTVVVPTNATATPAMVLAVAAIPKPFVIAGVEWSVWDGQHEIQLSLDGVWNGTSIDSLTFDEVIA